MKPQSTNDNVPVLSKFTFTTTKIVLTNINFSIHRSACIFKSILHYFGGCTEATDSPLSDRGCPLSETPILFNFEHVHPVVFS
jgi:hypothetical protein